MPERIKRAHIKRARENYDNPDTETPGEFEDYLQGQYVDEYGKDNPKANPNKKVVDRYKGYLAQSRPKDTEERPGLLGYVETEGKGPYPANVKEDTHLVTQIMKFLHSEKISSSVAKQLAGDSSKITESIASIAANISLKLVSEIRKQRDVNDEAESAIVTIVAEDLWTVARSLGMKRVPPEFVENSVEIAGNLYNKMEEGMKTGQTEQMQPVEQLPGEQQPPPEQPQEQAQPQEGVV